MDEEKRVLLIHSYEVENEDTQTVIFYEDGTYRFTHWETNARPLLWKLAHDAEGRPMLMWKHNVHAARWGAWQTRDTHEMGNLLDGALSLNKILT